MPVIKFVRHYLVKDGSGTEYAAGDTLECDQAGAQHFINRRAAILVEEPTKPKRGRKTKAVEDEADGDTEGKSDTA